MKICLVSEYYYPTLGGITEHVYQHSKQCLLKGHAVTLLTSDAGLIPDNLIPPGLKICKIGKSYPIMSNGSFARVTLGWGLGDKVRKFFSDENFDVVHVQAALMPTLPLLALKYARTRVVGTMHTYFDESFLYDVLAGPCQRALDAHHGLIAVSQSCIDAMSRYFEVNATIIPNGVDIDYFARGKSQSNYHKGLFTVLFLGRLDPRNGLDTLISAYHILRQRGVNLRLLIAGDGPLRKSFESKVLSIYKDHVEFLGAVNEERPDLFASANVFCYPATKASFGITLLEAMSAGIPVVASNIRGFREVIQNHHQGLLVADSNPPALAEALEKIYRDSTLRDTLSQSGRIRAAEFSWDKVTDQILDYYRTVCA